MGAFAHYYGQQVNDLIAKYTGQFTRGEIALVVYMAQVATVYYDLV